MLAEIPNGWEVLYTKKEIEEAILGLVEELAEKLEEEGARDKGVILIEILESASVFTKAIERGLIEAGFNVKVESIEVSSYGGKPGERSELKIGNLEDISQSGENIRLLIDDMVDSGITMKKTIEAIEALVKTAPIFSVVLLQKLCSNFVPDFIAIKKCPNRWVAGFGINGNSEELGEKDGRDLEEIIVKKDML